MGFVRQHIGVLFVLAALSAGAVASCSLNPQPLPPDNPSDAGGIGVPTTSPTGGSQDGGAFGGAADSGSVIQGPDASQVSDAAAPSPGDGASDSATDAPDTDASDAAPPGDAPVGDAPAPDSGAD